jgi:hypothetical protein
MLATKEVAKILTNYFQDSTRCGMFFEGYGVDHLHSKLFPMHGAGEFSQGKPVQVEILDIKDVMKDRIVDLIKLNIEGMEYEVLERAIKLGLHKKMRNIQVQFHRTAINYQERYENIHQELLKTHELTYDFPFVWQNFMLKA